MPFTLSHPAAVVPLARWLPLSAMIAGALAPDLYFLALQTMAVGDVAVPVLGSVTTTYAHTWPGIATFSLPIAGCLWFLFHALAKWPLVALFPPATRQRLTVVAYRGAGRHWLPTIAKVVPVGAGIVVGLATHLLWDAATHRFSWIGEQVPALGAWIAWHGVAVRVDELLFIASSGGGLVLLAWWYRRWRAAAPVGGDLARPWGERTRVAILTLGSLAGVLLFAWLWQRQYWPANHREHFPFVLAVVIALHQMQQGLVVAVLAYCLGWWMCGRAQGGRPYVPPESL
jgi:hypothetical protein